MEAFPEAHSAVPASPLPDAEQRVTSDSHPSREAMQQRGTIKSKDSREERFDKLKRLSHEQKGKLRDRINTYQQQLEQCEKAANDYWSWIVILSLLALGILELTIDEVWVPLFHVPPLLPLPTLQQLFEPAIVYPLGKVDPNITITIVLGAFLITWMTAIAAMLLHLSTSFFSGSQARAISLVVWLSILLIGCVALLSYAASTRNWDSFYLPWVIHSAFLYPVLSILTIFWLVVLYFVKQAFKNGERDKYPIAVLLHTLIEILSKEEEESYRDQWTSLEHKQELLSKIEVGAVCLESHLPSKLSSGDVVTDIWMKDATKKMAAALREKKRWVLTPKKDTLDYLFNNLTIMLISVVEGNWDDLEMIEPEKPSFINSWRTRIITMCRILFTVALPTAFFLLMQRTPWQFKEPVLSYVIAGLFIWVLVVLIATVNPNFTTYTSAVKDIANFLPGNKSK